VEPETGVVARKAQASKSKSRHQYLMHKIKGSRDLTQKWFNAAEIAMKIFSMSQEQDP
jgi:hypothetical protein